MKPSTSRRLLVAALGLFALAPSARADALADAHLALAATDFAAMKSALDPYLVTNPQSDDAHVLRALARFGLATKDNLPAFLRGKLGAKTATIDFGTGDYDLTFPYRFTYGVADAFTVNGGTYSRTTALDGSSGRPSVISFENKDVAPYTLTLLLTRGADSTPACSLNFELNGEFIGFLSSQPDAPNPLFRYHFASFSPDLTANESDKTVTIVVPPGFALTIALVNALSDFRMTPAATVPSTVTIRNGKGVISATKALAPSANVADFFTFAGASDTAILTPIIDDLEAASPAVALTLSTDETGHAEDIVIAYPDVQLILAELKFLQGLRRLSTSYKFSLPLTPANLDANTQELLIKNPAFLTPNAPNKTQTADRLFARTLFTEAAAHYANASAGGLWDRPAPDSGAYLFTIPDGDGEFLKDIADGSIAQLSAALTETIPLANFDDGEASLLPPDAGFTFAPIFGSPALNPRKLVPVFTDKGVQRGGSLALLTSGLLPGFGTAGWEEFLQHGEKLDLTTPAIQTTAKIQRQPAALTSVPEGDPVTLSVVAECYPAPTYKWYRRIPKTPDGKTEEQVGENSPFFTLEAATRADAGNYFVRVSNTVTPPPPRKPIETTVTSTTAVLQVTYAPEITTQPADVTIYQGKTVTLDVAVTGVPKPASFQWFKGETAVTPVRAASKYTFLASAAKAGDYHVVVKNSIGEVTSETVTVDVQTKPVFTTNPTPQTAIVGGSVTFTAVATGNPAPQIKWRKNGKDIPDATGPSLTINPVALTDAGTYTAVALSTVNTSATTTTVVTTVSTGAKLTVTAGLGAAL